MFETLSLQALQQYWWLIISLLAAFLVFLLFVQGGQTLLYQIAKTEDEKTLLINALGRKWELTFTTLVTFGGAFFASFPLFYSTSFSGAYWLWMFILFGFIVQAVSYEYRKKNKNFIGSKSYEYFQIANGVLATFFLGIIVSTFFTGSLFTIDKYNLSTWISSYYGLETLFNFQNIFLGLTIFFLSRTTGAMFFLKYIDNIEINTRASKQILINGFAFVLFFVLFVIILLTKEGFAVDPNSAIVSMQKYKYLNNFIQMPFVLIIFILGVLFVLFGIYKGGVKKSSNSFWVTVTGVLPVVFSLFLVAGFNNTSFYPSTSNLQSSLTITNASSSKYTLISMSYVSLLLPVVIAYIVYVWKVLSKNKINKSELEQTGHVY